MIEIRPYDGDCAHLAEFVGKAWRQHYQGRMPVPYWTADLFARDAGSDATLRDYSIAAYDGARLVGLLPGWPATVQLHGQELLIRTGTGASVDTEYQRQGVGKLLNKRAMEHAREHGCALTLFYIYIRTREFKGTRFWRGREMPSQSICKLGHWVRPINHSAVSRWEMEWFEAWGTHILKLFQPRVTPPRDPSGIRPYRPEDLPACETMVRQLGDSMDLARRFDTQTLGRLLQYKDFAKTLVAEHEGRAAGLANFYYLDVFGRTLERLGVIDLFAFDPALPHKRRVDLMRAVLFQMKQDGLIAATMLRGSMHAWRVLLATGFFRMFPEYCLMGFGHRDDISVEEIRRLLLLWR